MYEIFDHAAGLGLLVRAAASAGRLRPRLPVVATFRKNWPLPE